ncbi:hypothetical protein PV10_01568 [Exophiala mesophila]|uniref:SMP-LTD domain-containing protein n=1 Tax=Exophiala mesophila TaxID=212818 RepID=A0A0D1X7M7_EXOME|nr:uncharacterized protein PV10_01568 [Exophiala mesophila]KIV97865.1 hypothetical protein PV10_01568 [Exophiala mesophila]
MGPFKWFLFVYVLGGLTFIPLLILLLFLHAYYTLPIPSEEMTESERNDPAGLKHPDDEKAIFKTGTDDLAEKFHRKHDSDVAAGYFAVCREYVPGGVNGKPPDKLTPAGDVVSTESPSVYQTMYRSIFDRSQKPTIEPNKDGPGKTVKKANNVFYVVLRHGHLMLYDDIQQLEVRYVISLDYHNVDIYGGGEEIPEGELWMKKNAIRLSRKKIRPGDYTSSLPFFLFSENLSEKEDFYFAILKNQERNIGDDAPLPQEFEVQHIVTLVQKLHSSEEHLQTRWLNAMIGRLFLAMYKTPEMEQFIRMKLTKKISRVKKPNFITKLALRKIDTGNSAPFITNPRLKDLTVNGDCVVEVDVNYSGHFRIEIAATARIELGSRFKPREVDMVLAATCKTLQGHVLLRFKPPPSNRIWVTFEKMPQLDLDIEPIVSSRQITYNVILRAIESRIREVVAETVVLPFWDDMPFLDTINESYRGGIWKREAAPVPSTDIPDEETEDTAESGISGENTPSDLKEERIMSMPALPDSQTLGKSNSGKKSATSLNEFLGLKSPDSPEKSEPPTPRLLRSTSFASAANPAVSTNHADGGTLGRDAEVASRRESVASVLKVLSAKQGSANPSPASSQAGSPPVDSSMASILKGRSDSGASTMSNETDPKPWDQQHTADSSVSRTPTMSSIRSNDSTSTLDNKSDSPSSQGSGRPKSFAQAAKSLGATDRKQALASLNAATAAAQKWGWGVLARNRQRDGITPGANGDGAHDNMPPPSPREPMGRGRPLPPPGIPLPPPERPSTKVVPKRKAVPPPFPPPRADTRNGNIGSARSSPKPALPDRRRRQSSMMGHDDVEDEVMVVEAPTESAPTSPAPSADENHDDFFGHGEASAEELPPKPPLPARRRSESPHEDFTQGQEELERREIGMYT